MSTNVRGQVVSIPFFLFFLDFDFWYGLTIKVENKNDNRLVHSKIY